MQGAKRWIVWAHDKQPFYVDGTPRRGTLDTPDDIERLATFDDACRAVQASNGRFAGVGFALGPDGAGGHWQGIDLDNVPENQLADLANGLPGYVEMSPSGNGAHAIGYGQHFASLGSNGSGIEAYASGRYFTFTGNTIRDGALVDLAPWVGQYLAPRHTRPAQAAGAASGAGSVYVDPKTVTELRSALNAIPADDYHEWIKIGRCLYELGNVGRELWLSWSQTEPEKWKPADAKKWGTFAGSTAPYQTVFKIAQEHGWVNPASNAAQFPPAAQPVQAQDDDSWLVDVARVVSHPSPSPEFLTQQILPAGQVTLLAGHGGAGKSILMLAWAARAAMGLPFLGKGTTQAPVIFYSGEDEGHIVRFRLSVICEHLNIDPAQLAKNLWVVDATDCPTLYEERYQPGYGTFMAPSLSYTRLQKLGAKVQARYFFIDNASETFDGDEIKRVQTRAFIRCLKFLGKDRGAGVVLGAHVDKQTASSSNGKDRQNYSGNTAWHNSVRSRLYLGEAGDDEPGLVLTHAKSNYGKLAQPIRLIWSQGGLLEQMNTEEAERVKETMDEVRLAELTRAIEALTAEGVDVPIATSGPRTAHHVLSAHPLYPKGMSAKQTNALILTGERARRIRRETYTNEERKQRGRWVLA